MSITLLVIVSTQCSYESVLGRWCWDYLSAAFAQTCTNRNRASRRDKLADKWVIYIAITAHTPDLRHFLFPCVFASTIIHMCKNKQERRGHLFPTNTFLIAVMLKATFTLHIHVQGFIQDILPVGVGGWWGVGIHPFPGLCMKHWCIWYRMLSALISAPLHSLVCVCACMCVCLCVRVCVLSRYSQMTVACIGWCTSL